MGVVEFFHQILTPCQQTQRVTIIKFMLTVGNFFTLNVRSCGIYSTAWSTISSVPDENKSYSHYYRTGTNILGSVGQLNPMVRIFGLSILALLMLLLFGLGGSLVMGALALAQILFYCFVLLVVLCLLLGPGLIKRR